MVVSTHYVLARGASRAVCVIGATNTNTFNIGMGGILILTGWSMQCHQYTKHRNGWNSNSHWVEHAVPPIH